MRDQIKVLIADDEALERKAIIEILLACRGKAFLTAEAVNGQDAIEKADAFHPDIVIMDLQMPVMDGFAALKEIYKHLPDVFAVILTAYDEFDYAVRALKLGVADYMLKPVRKKKLLECIEGFESKRRRLSAEQITPLPQEQTLEALFPYMEDNLISSIVMNEQISGHVHQLIHYLFPGGETFALAVGKEIRKSDAAAEAHTRLSGLRVPAAASAMGGQLILLLQCPKEDFAGWWGKLLPSLSDLCGQWAVDGPIHNINALHDICHRLTHGRYPQSRASVPSANISLEKDIAVKLATMDEHGALALFQELLSGRTSCPIDLVQQKLTSVCIIVDHYLSKMIDSASFGEIPDFRRFSEQHELFQAAKLFVASRTAVCQAHQQPRISKLIRDTIDDLECHYKDGLYSLNAAAEHLHLTPAYLSKVFKTRMGKTFTEYLNEIRIDEAKKLLRDSDSDIAEISLLCGFNSANYFCKVFKKFTGVSASDYREGRR